VMRSAAVAAQKGGGRLIYRRLPWDHDRRGSAILVQRIGGLTPHQGNLAPRRPRPWAMQPMHRRKGRRVARSEASGLCV